MTLQRGVARRTNADPCPHCGASLQGAPIPADEQESYGATHFSRKIGIYSREVDRTVAWRCPDCSHEWARV
jgi:DNA-directed RNA polymerase subunit RPC12/RpoP